MIKVRLLNKSFMIEESEFKKYEIQGYVKVDMKKEAELMQKIADRKNGKPEVKVEKPKTKVATK